MAAAGEQAHQAEAQLSLMATQIAPAIDNISILPALWAPRAGSCADFQRQGGRVTIPPITCSSRRYLVAPLYHTGQRSSVVQKQALQLSHSNCAGLVIMVSLPLTSPAASSYWRGVADISPLNGASTTPLHSHQQHHHAMLCGAGTVAETSSS